jgi:hypothetical protein
MPCGLFSRDIGAKNARKIVFIASTRKSVFAGAALAIGASIAKQRVALFTSTNQRAVPQASSIAVGHVVGFSLS